MKRLALEAGAYAAEVNDGVPAGRPGRDGAGRGDRGGGGRAELVRLPLSPGRDDRAEDRGDRQTGLRRRRDLPAQDRARQDRALRRRRARAGSRSAWRRRTSRSRHDVALTNAPTGFTVTVRDIRAYTGAGWLVALCGDMQTMPGLSKTPAAFNVDIDEKRRAPWACSDFDVRRLQMPESSARSRFTRVTDLT